MKTIQNMRSHLVLALIVLFAGTSFQASAQRVSVSFQTFYNELQPYGSWFNHADYGYVWAPAVDGDFTPYATNGYWTVTQYGNTWVSNYDWGWAPFHYGRWYMDDFYGWIWVPDTVWSPGWVVWRNGGGYYGWAPMSPGLHFSFSLNLFNRIPHNYWTFCSQQYVWSTSWYSYSAPRYRNVYIVNNTNYVNNYYVDNSNHYYCGPSNRDIQRATGRPVRVRGVEESNRPSQYRMDLDKVVIYRPAVSHDNNDKPKFERTPKGNNGNQFGWTKGHEQDDDTGNGGGRNGGNENGGGGSNSGNDNSGNDNGSKGNGGNSNGTNGNANNGGRTDSYNKTFPSERNQTELPSRNEDKGSENRTRIFEQKKPAQWDGGSHNRQSSAPRTMPERKVDSKRDVSMSFPKSGGSRESSGMKAPSRSNGGSGMNIPKSSGGSNRMSAPSGSRGSGGMSAPSRSGGSKGFSPKKK